STVFRGICDCVPLRCFGVLSVDEAFVVLRGYAFDSEAGIRVDEVDQCYKEGEEDIREEFGCVQPAYSGGKDGRNRPWNQVDAYGANCFCCSGEIERWQAHLFIGVNECSCR